MGMDKVKKEAPKVVAEIGCNHKGDMQIAFEMIEVAKNFCHVDYVKFQKRNNTELLSEEEYNAPHPVPGNSYGKTYGEHREFLEFNLDQHRQLKDHCDRLGIGYSTSVWDTTSAREICSLSPDFIKVPSACNLNFEMQKILIEEFSGDIHVSLGMTTQAEEVEIVNFYQEHSANQRVILYACTSGYPVAFEDLCLYEVSRLRDSFADKVKQIGFSGHHLGIAADVAAMTLGAEWIERHFTLDRTWKGTDHAASLESDGLRKLVRDVRNVYKALTYKAKDILEVEQVQRNKLKRCLDQ